MLLSSFADNLQPRSSDPAENVTVAFGKKIFSPRPKQSPGPPTPIVHLPEERNGEREREMIDAPGLQKNAEKNRRLYFSHLLSDSDKSSFSEPGHSGCSYTTVTVKQNRHLNLFEMSTSTGALITLQFSQVYSRAQAPI